ncbi:MAG: thioredoxin, partial [Leptospirales bacterium]
MAIHTTLETFDEQVLQPSQKVPVLVDFWAEWCNPCKIIGPILENLEKVYEGRMILAKVNTETEQKLAVQYQVNSIPTMLFFYQQNVADQLVGALPEENIIEFIEHNLPDPELVKATEMADAKEYEKAGQLIIEKK